MKRLRVKLISAVGGPIFFAACATIGPPQPPSLELPKPPTDLRAERKGDRVILTWSIPTATTDRQTLRSLGVTEICRGVATEQTECGTPVGKAPAVNSSASSKKSSGTNKSPAVGKSSKRKISDMYTDRLPAELESDSTSAVVVYAVEVLNQEGRGAGLSNQVRVPAMRTMAPPQDFAAKVTGQGVVLSWTGEAMTAAAGVRYIYRVSRSGDGQKQPMLVTETPAGEERRFEVTDSGIEWEKTYEYRAETVTVIAEANKPEVQIEGEDSPAVKVFTHDVFPPAVPAGLQAVFSGPGQERFVDLVWAPVPDVDLAGYNVYRRTDGGTAVKVNAELVKSPAYRDASVEAGKNYIYAVSAVDVRGNESGRSEEASETVPR